MMTYKQWVNQNKGKKIDFDGLYGVQCVDLAKHFIKNCLGVTPQNIGDAKQYWLKRNSKYISAMFVPVVNSDVTVPHTADVFVRTSGSCGHIGVCTGNADKEMFFAYEQNYGGTHEGMTLHQHTNWATINFLRPKFQYVVTNGGNLYGYTKKKSTNPTIKIPNGSRVEIIETECYQQDVKGTTYMFERIIYKGKKYYVADKFIRFDK